MMKTLLLLVAISTSACVMDTGDGGDPTGGMHPSIETPVPGQRNPVAVNVQALEPSIEGRHVTVLLSWWSGPAPCSPARPAVPVLPAIAIASFFLLGAGDGLWRGLVG